MNRAEKERFLAALNATALLVNDERKKPAEEIFIKCEKCDP